MTKNELCAENHTFTTYIYYYVLCSDRILMIVLIFQIAHCIYTIMYVRLSHEYKITYLLTYLLNVRSIKLSEYNSE